MFFINALASQCIELQEQMEILAFCDFHEENSAADIFQLKRWEQWDPNLVSVLVDQ